MLERPLGSARAHSTNGEPACCPISGIGEVLGANLGRRLDHWLEMTRGEEMTSERVPSFGSGIDMTPGCIYSLNSLFKEFVCSERCRDRYKAGGVLSRRLGVMRPGA